MTNKTDTLIYKSHKVLDLYHERCGNFVSGNGSMAFPYTCPCGEWEHDIETTGKEYTYRLKDD